MPFRRLRISIIARLNALRAARTVRGHALPQHATRQACASTHLRNSPHTCDASAMPPITAATRAPNSSSRVSSYAPS